MTQGNVGKWKKKEGETVAAGDVLCDIETDKATLDFESLEDGVLAKILIPAGTKDVPVGQALCVVAESAEGVEQFASYSAGAGPTPSPQPKQQAPPSSPPATAPSPSPQRSPPSDLPPHEVLTMPALSPTMVMCLEVKVLGGFIVYRNMCSHCSLIVCRLKGMLESGRRKREIW
jgi:pyruvate dehydrogenase E2 component (dihydrolipoamide acetyltransferase)